MAATLEMNPSPAESEPALQVKPPMRFTYASGSRPLDGYTIKRGVGRGGFGEVYFAVSDAGKEVALKLIRRNLEVELRGVTHCLNLKHPNLVALYDIRTDEHEDRWVVMEYVSGESLEDLIDRYPEGMPKETALHWFDGICSAVAYLHDHGIVHRDLKPANIFLDDGIIKIGDYGLSKFISCSRRSGQTESVGTVHYMAPEIANGRYGREIDAYALGIILYEMLTGRVPFEGESVGEVLMKHLTAEPKLDVLEEPFRSVVRGAMAKDPERRINNAAEMITMLRGEDYVPVEVVPGISTPATPFNPQRGGQAAPAQPNGDGGPRTRRPGGPAAFFHREPEPILAGLKRAWPALLDDLNYDNWTTLGRVVFALFIFFILAGFAPFWLALAALAACCYAAYRVVRIIVRISTDDPYPLPRAERTPQVAVAALALQRAGEPLNGDHAREPSGAAVTIAKPVAATAERRPWRRRGQATWRQAAYQSLAAQSVRQRTSTVFGSMLAAAVVAPVAALLACMFTSPELPVELFLWTAIVGTISSWAIMLPGQLVEGRMEDHAPLRFANVLLGAVVGMVAWGVAESMYLKLPAARDMGPEPSDTLFAEMFGWNFEALDGAHDSGAVQMPLAMYAAYFAFLFLIVRWWRLAEWTRSSRVSLWAVAWCGGIGWVLSLFWWFPQPIGMMTAAVIAFTVQLSSPWLSPSGRRELAEKVA